MTQIQNDFLKDDIAPESDHLMEIPTRRKLSSFGHAKEREEILESLSMLIASGMDIGSIFESLAREAHTKYTKEILEGIKEDIDTGNPLWKALGGSGLFTDQTIAFIKLGEESGRLPETMLLIVEQAEKQRMFNSQIRSALMYPVMVLGVSGVVGLGITWFIIPRLAVTFGQLHLKLPLLTRIIVNLGNFLIHYGYFAVPLFIALLLLTAYIFFFNRKTKFMGQSILLHTPIFSKLIKEVELARFGYTLGSLLSAGMPIVEALNSLKRSTDFRAYGAFYEFLEKSTGEGQSFQNSLRSYPKASKLFPPAMQDMIINAEQSGKLADTFSRIGKTYEGRIETTSKNLTVLLEPILLIIVWLVVLFIALAIIMPIYSIFDGIRNNDVNTTTTTAPTPVNSKPQDTNTPTTGSTEPVKETPATTPVNTPTGTPPSTANPPTEEPVPISSGKELTITATPTGYLNVREEPSKTGTILTKVYPGEHYTYTDHTEGWYQIELKDGNLGWISESYVTINTKTTTKP